MVHPRHISSRARTAGSQPTSTNDGQEVSKKSKLGQFQISLMKMNTEKEREEVKKFQSSQKYCNYPQFCGSWRNAQSDPVVRVWKENYGK